MKYATKKILRDYTATVTIAVGLAILIRTFVVEAYRIPSQSMKPALLAGDTIFVTKWSQKLKKDYLPNRGDIVVFTNSSSATSNSGIVSKGPDYIRRVVGLPGDTLALRNGHLLLNGVSLLVRDKKVPNSSCFQERLAQSVEYVEYQICSEGSFLPDFGPEKVPPNSVFVIEDTRTPSQQNTLDLHQGALKRKGWGIIPLSSIKGKARWIWLSIKESNEDGKSSWLPKFRWDRMFRRI